MKLILTTLVALHVFQTAFGQVHGQVATTDHQFIPFVNVLLLNPADSALVKGMLTDESGRFSFDHVNSGRYFLRCSAVGFKTLNSSVFQVNPLERYDMGHQTLEEDAHQLQEIIIKADKPLYEQQPDRTVINVGSSVMTKGSSALQVLERSPGVSIDYQNNGIALNGKSDVMIM